MRHHELLKGLLITSLRVANDPLSFIHILQTTCEIATDPVATLLAMGAPFLFG